MTLREQLLDAASKLGVAQSLLNVYGAVSNDITVPEVDDRIRQFSLSRDDTKGVVLFPVIPGYATWVYRACILGHAFRTRGYRPILLVEDGDFELSPAATVEGNETKAAELSRFYQSTIPEKFGMKPRSIKDVLSSSWTSPEVNAIEDGHYRGVDIDRYAVASTRKYLKSYTIDESSEDVQRTYESFVRGGIRLADACHSLLESHDIAATVVNESAYVHGGVPADITHHRGIPAFSQKLGYLDETVVFGRAGNRSTHPHFTRPSVVEEILSTPLDTEERQHIEEIMAGRRSGDTAVIQYSAQTDTSVDVPDNCLLVGMFTNLLWDASLVPDNAPYANVYDWITETLAAFEDLDGAHLVLKTHPAESKLGTRESVTDWLQERDTSVPANVTVLPPSTNVDTYALVDELDVGLVYTSTVGLEMAYVGVPVVVAGDAHYRNFGFTMDPADPEAYRSVLEDLYRLEATEETERRARRYAHLLFARKHIDFPYCASENIQSYRFRPVNHDELTPGNEPWDGIVESVLADEEVLAPR